MHLKTTTTVLIIGAFAALCFLVQLFWAALPEIIRFFLALNS